MCFFVAAVVFGCLFYKERMKGSVELDEYVERIWKEVGEGEIVIIIFCMKNISNINK